MTTSKYQLKRSYTTGSMMEILQQSRQNMTAPLQLYSSGVLFSTNFAKCQSFQHETDPCGDGENVQICDGNLKREIKARTGKTENNTRTTYDFNNSDEIGKLKTEEKKESVSCHTKPYANYAKQTERMRLSQHEPSWSQRQNAADHFLLPRTRTHSMSDKYLKTYLMRQPLCDAVRSTRFRNSDCNFSPSKHLSHIQDLGSFPRERISSVSSTNTVQCVDSYDLPGTTDCNFNVSPDWSITSQAFRLVIAGEDKAIRKLFLDRLLLCGEADANDDVFDVSDEDKAEQTITIKFNEEHYSLTLCEIEDDEVAVSDRDDALIIVAENTKALWLRDLLRGLKVSTPCLIIVVSSEHEVVSNSLADDSTSLEIQFKSVNLHDHNTVQKFMESLIQDLLLESPTPMRENTLERQVPVDKHAIFSRFFWRTVSTTRSCENLLAL